MQTEFLPLSFHWPAAPPLPFSELPKGMSLWQAALQSPCFHSNHAGEEKATKPWTLGEARDGPLHPILLALVTFMIREMALGMRSDDP